MIGQDEMIHHLIIQKAMEFGETSVSCFVEEGRVLLEGQVSTDEQSYELEAAVRTIPGVRAVSNQMAVEGFEARVDNYIEGVDLVPDFAGDGGAEAFGESVSEAEPYFPPTDPVVKSDRSSDGIEMLGGFAKTADDLDAATANLPGMPRGDDELRDAVVAALHADAATTDLVLDVEVQEGAVRLRGTVASLEDVDLAESVAARVTGVEEVQEELEIEGM